MTDRPHERCYGTTANGRRCLLLRGPRVEFCGRHAGQDPTTGMTPSQLECEFRGITPAGLAREYRADEAFFVAVLRREHWRESNAVVYFLARDHLIKIGYTTDLQGRMRSLGHTLDDVLAVVPGGPSVERRLHQELAHLRVRGEWFAADDEILDVIVRELEGRTAAQPS